MSERDDVKTIFLCSLSVEVEDMKEAPQRADRITMLLHHCCGGGFRVCCVSITHIRYTPVISETQLTGQH